MYGALAQIVPDLDTAKVLGSGSAQMILAIGLMFSFAANVWLIRELIITLRGNTTDARTDVKTQLASNTDVVNTIRTMQTSVDAMVKMADRFLDQTRKA